ncbi:MAG: ABC transporter ATP-binding protein [Streptococcus salivarius]
MKQLNVTGLTKTFGQGDNIVHALLDVNLSVEKGEFLAIMGASGSGKTTLLNCISTIDKPTSGEIRFEDFDIIHAKENELADYRAKNISYIFQAYNLVETLTVYENIVLPLQIQGKTIKKHQDKIEEILDKLAIQNLKDKFPNQLSGGQRQRVATARALIDDSKLIIADEPTGALDSANSEKLMVLLQEINKSFGITILLVTHDPAAAKYSSRMVLLSDGKIMDDLERNSLSNEQYLQEIYSVPDRRRRVCIQN